MEMKIGKMKIDDVPYLKESDVDKYYTRKDNVEVDRMVLEAALLKMRPDELTTLMTSMARKKLEAVGYAELSEMMDASNYEEYTKNKLLMIANVGRM